MVAMSGVTTMPSSHQLQKLRPFELAIAAGMNANNPTPMMMKSQFVPVPAPDSG
jgi:hypothetical protein